MLLCISLATCYTQGTSVCLGVSKSAEQLAGFAGFLAKHVWCVASVLTVWRLYMRSYSTQCWRFIFSASRTWIIHHPLTAVTPLKSKAAHACLVTRRPVSGTGASDSCHVGGEALITPDVRDKWSVLTNWMYGAEVTDEKKGGSFLLLLLGRVDPQERIKRRWCFNNASPDLRTKDVSPSFLSNVSPLTLWSWHYPQACVGVKHLFINEGINKTLLTRSQSSFV